MTAHDHTERQLRWLVQAGVSRYDLGVLQRDAGGQPAGMRRHTGLTIADLRRHLPWARAQNARGADVYIRAAAAGTWPVIWLDDLSESAALTIAGRLSALVVRTSPGLCHVWVRVARPLDLADRGAVQRELARRWGADPASTDGGHFGRVGGMRNHKRGGCWTGVLASTGGPSLPVDLYLSTPPAERGEGGARGGFAASAARPGPGASGAAGAQGMPGQHDQSARDWAWTCAQLERGADPAQLEIELAQSAEARGKRSPSTYARRTVERALARVNS